MEKLIEYKKGVVKVDDRLFTPNLPKDDEDMDQGFDKLMGQLVAQEIASGNRGRVYSGGPPSPEKRRIMDMYGCFFYTSQPEISDKNLGQTVETLEILAKMVQEAFLKAKGLYGEEEKLILQLYPPEE